MRLESWPWRDSKTFFVRCLRQMTRFVWRSMGGEKLIGKTEILFSWKDETTTLGLGLMRSDWDGSFLRFADVVVAFCWRCCSVLLTLIVAFCWRRIRGVIYCLRQPRKEKNMLIIHINSCLIKTNIYPSIWLTLTMTSTQDIEAQKPNSSGSTRSNSELVPNAGKIELGA